MLPFADMNTLMGFPAVHAFEKRHGLAGSRLRSVKISIEDPSNQQKEKPWQRENSRSAFGELAFSWALAASITAWKSPRAQAETITVTHWGGQFYGVPYAVAMEKGFFKKNGVDVTGILTAAGGGTAVRNTLAGGIPFGEVSLAAAVQAINSGQKLIIIGAGAQVGGRPDVGGEEGFAPQGHQGSDRQTDRLYRAGLGQQHGDPDGAEGQRHHPAAGEAGAGRRSRRQPLRRRQRRGRCRLLR